LNVLLTDALQESLSGITQLEAESCNILIASSASRTSLICACSTTCRESDVTLLANTRCACNLVSCAALSVEGCGFGCTCEALVTIAGQATGRALSASSGGFVQGEASLASNAGSGRCASDARRAAFEAANLRGGTNNSDSKSLLVESGTA
jgi:hypothetical protein